MELLTGATMLAFAGISLFFWKFWRRTGDPFFALFSLGFALFATNRLIYYYLDNEHRLAVYVVRLVAFAAILTAILHKNMTGRRG